MGDTVDLAGVQCAIAKQLDCGSDLMYVPSNRHDLYVCMYRFGVKEAPARMYVCILSGGMHGKLQFIRRNMYVYLEVVKIYHIYKKMQN